MTNNENEYGSPGTSTVARHLLFFITLLVLGTPSSLSPSELRAAEVSRLIPAPALDETTASSAATEVAVLAGGCFWGVQGVFQHVKGVTSAVSGYAGGDKRAAHYETVSSGTTGHAESVQVTFDPRQITYGRILQIYFSVAHNPTQLNRQGPDTGTQYRSSIFTKNEEQAKIAKAYIVQLNKAGVFNATIATIVAQLQGFYAAESYHQNFLVAHPNHPYIVINDIPKIQNLLRVYPHIYRVDPVLVATVGASN